MAANRLESVYEHGKLVCHWVKGDASIIMMPAGIGKHIKNPGKSECLELLIFVLSPRNILDEVGF